jgi:hypothetical protein
MEMTEREEIVKRIMNELGIEGASKKRLLLKLAEECDDDEKKIIYKAKRTFITERLEKVNKK